MKKTLLFILFALFCDVTFAQKIKESKIDDFSGEKVIYTSWEKLKTGNGITGKNNFVFMFRYENNIVYMHIKWVTADVTSIKENDQIIFKMTEGVNITFKALSYVMSSKGGGSTGLQMSAIEGIDPIYIGDFSPFDSDNYVTKFRINTSKGYVDIDLKDKDAKKINDSYKLLLSEISKK